MFTRANATFAIYPPHDAGAFRQVEMLRKAGRIDTYAEADYSEGKQAYMWIAGKIEEFAARICEEQYTKLRNSTSDVPRHLDT